MNKNATVEFCIDGTQLKLDVVLAEYIYPVLFTCIDSVGNMYIAACTRADGESKEWIVAGTSPRKVISLLKNEIEIREMFLHTPLWMAIMTVCSTEPKCHRLEPDKVDPAILPTEGEYMDADPHEFDTEIEKLSQRDSTFYAPVFTSFMQFMCASHTVAFSQSWPASLSNIPYDSGIVQYRSALEVSCHVCA